MPATPLAKAFTQRYNGITDVLKTECIVYPAFEPKVQRFPDGCKVECLWDTGATNSVISARLVKALNLKPIGKVTISHAQGQTDVNTYLINIMLTNNVGVTFLRVSEGVLSGFDMLIGMDIISQGDFSLSCSSGKTVFSFQTPSTHEVDYVTGKMVQTPIVKDKNEPGRNDPCPCGSGKKYKHCCGKQ
jgi:hypothetical protein